MNKSLTQSEFMIQYMGHMLLDGDTIEDRERIQRFLALQDKTSRMSELISDLMDYKRSCNITILGNYLRSSAILYNLTY